VAAASATALRIARSEPELRTRLQHVVSRMRAGLADLGLDLPRSLPTPAIGFTTGDGERMRTLAATLRGRGLLVPYFPSYSGLGPDGALRVAVFATHTGQHIDRLLDTLREIL
jgi:7-keto-8-aminopelargonate synthetase-like enzyme